MILKKIIRKLFYKKNELAGIWETKHGNNHENLMRLFEDGTGMIFYWMYEINEEPRELVYEIEWKKIGFRRVAFKLKTENKFTSIKYRIKPNINLSGEKYDELYDPYFSIGNNKDVKFFWKVNGKLYRKKNDI